MLSPTQKNYNRAIDRLAQPTVFLCGGVGLHPNPRLYKSYWQVFTPDLPWQGKEFFQFAPMLCTAQYVELIERLQLEGSSCMVYCKNRPRLDCRNPWDMTSQKWRTIEFAPSWDDDDDPVWSGHK